MAEAFEPHVRFTRVFRVALVISLASVPATPADAQDLRPIIPAVAVRVWTGTAEGARPIVGKALAQDSATLRVMIANQAETVVRLATIDSLQVLRTINPSKARKYGILGALIGGTTLGLMMYASAHRDGTEGLGAGLGAVGGIAAGALVGMAMGASRKQEEWTTVRPPIRLAMSAQRSPDAARAPRFVGPQVLMHRDEREDGRFLITPYQLRLSVAP